jgi:AcrR family transcriptional regulator
VTHDTARDEAGATRADASGRGGSRPRRADARRNTDALLEAATTVFATAGVDAPAKQITDLAGVGVGTLYRHFPQRSDLVKAVFRRELDACADAAPGLAAEHGPGEALEQWLWRYTEFLATKRGLASALHSGDPAFDDLPAYFMQRFGPALGGLLDAATGAGEIRSGITAKDLLYAIAHLCLPVDDEGPDHNERMVRVLIDGLRYGADADRPSAC